MGSSGSHSIKAPAPSAPLPTVSTASDDAIEAYDEERKKLKTTGQTQTILTGAGIGAATTSKKQTLSGAV